MLDFPILFLSKYIVEHKDDYYYTLAGVTQRGAWKDWLLYMLKAVEATANDTYFRINDIIHAKDAILEAIRTETEIRRPEILTEVIFTQPFSKVKHFVDNGIFSEKTARQYLNKLSDMSALEKRTIEGNHYYLNLELNRILAQ